MTKAEKIKMKEFKDWLEEYKKTTEEKANSYKEMSRKMLLRSGEAGACEKVIKHFTDFFKDVLD